MVLIALLSVAWFCRTHTMPFYTTWFISFHPTSEGLELKVSRRHVHYLHQVSKRCIFSCESCLESVFAAAACWGEFMLYVHLMQREPWCKVAPRSEHRSPAIDAGRRCRSLKFQSDSLSAKNSLWRRTTADIVEIPSGKEAWQLLFMSCSQNGSACKWAVCLC